ncbi:MAG: ATP-binding cassette domain-containing protein [Terracidiphilus sp.]
MNVQTISDASPQASPSLLESVPLEVDSLVKRFGPVTAVDGVSLELRGGECLGLLGPNGAGKSTLIRGIVGRVIPDAGRVAVFGSPAGSLEARAALGWVPQELALYPRLTCRENLAAFGRYHTASPAASWRNRWPGAWTGPPSPIAPESWPKTSPAA